MPFDLSLAFLLMAMPAIHFLWQENFGEQKGEGGVRTYRLHGVGARRWHRTSGAIISGEYNLWPLSFQLLGRLASHCFRLAGTFAWTGCGSL